MRSKRRTKIQVPENRRNVKHESMLKAMATILQRERQQHQAIVVELRSILNEEREQINIFLKDMKKILDDMESNDSNRSLNNIHVMQIYFFQWNCHKKHSSINFNFTDQ